MRKHYFKRSFISNFRFDEYFETFGELLRRAEALEVEDSHLLFVINNVKAHSDPLGRVVERKKFHDNSTVIQDKVTLRHRKLRSIAKAADAMLDADTAEKREAAKVVSSFVRKERRAFSRERQRMQTGLCTRMALELDDNNSNLLDAVDTLDIMGIALEAIQLSKEIVTLSEERDVEKSELTDLAEELRRKSYYHLTIMLATFEHLANMVGEDQQFYHKSCMNLRKVIIARTATYLQRIGKPDEIEDEDNLLDPDSEHTDGGSDETSEETQNGSQNKES